MAAVTCHANAGVLLSSPLSSSIGICRRSPLLGLLPARRSCRNQAARRAQICAKLYTVAVSIHRALGSSALVFGGSLRRLIDWLELQNLLVFQHVRVTRMLTQSRLVESNLQHSLKQSWRPIQKCGQLAEFSSVLSSLPVSLELHTALILQTETDPQI